MARSFSKSASGPASRIRQEMPFCVKIFAAMPPECPEPTIRTSYVLTAIKLSSFDWIDGAPIVASAARAASKAVARLLRGRRPLARIHRGGPQVLVNLRDEVLERIVRKVLGPRPRHQQGPQNGVGLPIIQSAERLVKLL